MLSLGGHEYEAPKYSEWKNTFFKNSIDKFECKTTEIINCSLKEKDKFKLLNKLKDIIENKILILKNK